MANKTICLKPHEIPIVQSGKGTLIRPLDVPEHDGWVEFWRVEMEGYPGTWLHGDKFVFEIEDKSASMGRFISVKNRYPVGSVLKVRESWRISAWSEDFTDIEIEYRSGDKKWFSTEVWDENRCEDIWVELSNWCNDNNVATNEEGHFIWDESPFPWRSPATMPALFSRYTIRITGVEVGQTGLDHQDKKKCKDMQPCALRHFERIE